MMIKITYTPITLFTMLATGGDMGLACITKKIINLCIKSLTFFKNYLLNYNCIKLGLI